MNELLYDSGNAARELIIAEEDGHITRLFLSQEDWMDWKESVQNTEHMETPYLAEAKNSFMNISPAKERDSHCRSAKGHSFSAKSVGSAGDDTIRRIPKLC